MAVLGKLLKSAFVAPAPMPTPVSEDHLIVESVQQQEGGVILCFAAGSEGDALKELIYWGVAPLRHDAAQIVVVDLRDRRCTALLSDVLRKPIWFAASHFGAGQGISIERDGKIQNLWDFYRIPFLRIFGDYPAYFPDRHARHHRSSMNNYFDRGQVQFYKRWFRETAPCTVLPPYCFDPLPLDQVNARAKLNGKIVFPKNGNSPDELRKYWRTALPRVAWAGLEAVAEQCTAADQINRLPMLDDRLVAHYEKAGLDLEANRAILCFLAAQLDDYLRRVKSTMIARAIIDLPVIIRGRFWDHVDFRGKRAIHDPDSDYFRTAPIIDQAPAIIDMSPNTTHVPHDRIGRATGRGTAFITNMQEFMREAFPRPERFGFEFDIDSIRNCVEHYVENPQEAVELGLEQARAFRARYPEERYAEMLRDAVQLCALRLADRPPGTQNFVAYPSQLM